MLEQLAYSAFSVFKTRSVHAPHKIFASSKNARECERLPGDKLHILIKCLWQGHTFGKRRLHLDTSQELEFALNGQSKLSLCMEALNMQKFLGKQAWFELQKC